MPPAQPRHRRSSSASANNGPANVAVAPYPKSKPPPVDFDPKKPKAYSRLQLKHVEKYRVLGAWSEDDQQKWELEKRFKCDICGDRASTRYNLNRHHNCVHAQKNVDTERTWKCDICGENFSREDGVYKHKRAIHGISSASPEGLEQDGDEMDGDAQFARPHGGSTGGIVSQAAAPRKRPPPKRPQSDPLGSQILQEKPKNIVPRRAANALDLPNANTPGFLKYYTKLPFIPAQFFQVYPRIFFRDDNFSPHLPIIHISLASDLDNCLAHLIRAIACIAILYDQTSSKKSYAGLGAEFYESGRKLLERWIERGSEEDELTSVTGNITGTVHGTLALGNKVKEGTSLDTEGLAQKTREGLISTMQSLVLFSMYGFFSEEGYYFQKSTALFSRAIQIARMCQYWNDFTAVDGVQWSDWEYWLHRETKKRTAFSLYLMDCYLTIVFKQPSSILTIELEHITLPYPDELFLCPNSRKFEQLRAQDSSLRLYEPPKFLSVFRSLLHHHSEVPNGNSESSGVKHLYPLSSWIVVTLLLAEINKRGRDTYLQEEVPNLWTDQVSDVNYFDRVRHALNKLDEITISPQTDFESRHSHIGRMDPKKSIGGKMEATYKLYKLTWHLAYVFSFVPDSQFLIGQVGTDCKEALDFAVQAAMQRESTQEVGIDAMEIKLGHIMEHLIEIVHYMAAREYDDQRTVEFPFVVGLLFKSVLVIWEVLRRLYKFRSLFRNNVTTPGANNIKRESMSNTTSPVTGHKELPSQYPNCQRFEHVVYQRLKASKAEQDRQARASNSLPNSTPSPVSSSTHSALSPGGSDGDRIDRIFVQWAQVVFENMRAWDIGGMVGAAIEELVFEEFAESDEGGNSVINAMAMDTSGGPPSISGMSEDFFLSNLGGVDEADNVFMDSDFLGNPVF